MAEPASPLLQQQEGSVLTLTLNRPQALNSFNGGLHDALLRALKVARKRKQKQADANVTIHKNVQYCVRGFSGLSWRMG